MIYIYTVGVHNYIGESALENAEAEIVGKDDSAMEKLIRQLNLMLLEYGVLMEMGNQVGIMHQFSPLYLSGDSVTALRAIPEQHELAKLFRKTRDAARKDDLARRSGIITPGAEMPPPGPGIQLGHR